MPRPSISIEEAESLSKDCDVVNLDITSGLTADVAALLIRARKEIFLNSLTLLRDDVAEVLAEYPGELQLGGVRLTASVDAIRHLSRHKGPSLNILNLLELNLEVANYLAEHRGKLSISASNDAQFTEEVIAALARHQGDLWILAQLELSESMIKALLQHKGELGLPQISNMSAKMARQFKKHDGKVVFPMKIKSKIVTW
jgi:hypothetical protein